MDFFYDEQIRRYLLQFIRLFSDLKIKEGPDSAGNIYFNRVPVRYADFHRMVGHIQRENSESTTLPSPLMTVWINSIERLDSRRQDPSFERQLEATEREYDKDSGSYTKNVGNRYSIKRHMPVPYMMNLRLDMWTTNTTTKLQLIEQILVLFNPTVQINQNDNPLDWSSVTEVTLQDIDFTNRSIPVGTESERDVASITFNMPIWINPPAKVTRRKVIDHIFTRTNLESDIDLEQETNNLILNPDSDGEFFETKEDFLTVVSPGNYRVAIGVDDAGDNEVMLLDENGNTSDDVTWNNLLISYGPQLFNDKEVSIRLITTVDNQESNEFFGTLERHPNDDRKMIVDIDEDSFPGVIDSVSPVNKVINPKRTYPGNGIPFPKGGEKYLVVSNSTDPLITPESKSPWGNITFSSNDIIMYNGAGWEVVFDATEEEDDQYVKDIDTGYILRFTGNDWIHGYFGEYKPGYWRIQF